MGRELQLGTRPHVLIHHDLSAENPSAMQCNTVILNGSGNIKNLSIIWITVSASINPFPYIFDESFAL